MYKELTECLKAEVQKGSKPFSWSRTIRRAIKCTDRRFYFWLRIWCYLYQTNKFGMKGFAKRRMRKLNRANSIDINPLAKIGAGLKIVHFTGIVIRGNTVIGKNAVIRQNVTIGARNDTDEGYTVIGENAEFGANSCIIGDITIGNNVTIGAMSLINKNVPDNHTVYNSKNMIVIRNAA
ncbi:serine acetyltransferase [Enterobacter cloacae]|uniref:serine acetyltransferase n=1 Tax=Enterobacter cloacae TaxID=550 RepID=UPI00101B09B7|nr:serine acetyltransferase [Enterobacter cloacae]QBC01161.1 serine acetyltransferase [Enterobacter cloacae]